MQMERSVAMASLIVRKGELEASGVMVKCMVLVSNFFEVKL